MNKTIVKILTKVKTILEEKGWTQGVNARDMNGNPIQPRSNKACSYCLVGALWKATTNADYMTLAYDELTNSILHTKSCVIRWNDDKRRTKKQVLSLLDKTIAKLST